jgi:crotonobetainyl-CoA:carnitine CoA-transferase CaiB-like acyl-CoA transferase
MTRPVASNALSLLRGPDLSRLSARPTGCRIAADVGADVIKIEALDGVDHDEGMPGRMPWGSPARAASLSRKAYPHSLGTRACSIINEGEGP